MSPTKILKAMIEAARGCDVKVVRRFECGENHEDRIWLICYTFEPLEKVYPSLTKVIKFAQESLGIGPIEIDLFHDKGRCNMEMELGMVVGIQSQE